MTRAETEQVLREIGAAQHGVALRRQLLASGIADHVIDRLVQAGRLVVMWRGVYQIGPVLLPRAPVAAAALACGDESRISHKSAGILTGMLDVQPSPLPVEVTMPRRSRRRLKGVRVYRTRDLYDDEVTTLDGIPITTPARTLLDIAAVLTRRDVEQAFAKALRMGLTTREEMQRMIERHPRHRGTKVIRELLAIEGGPAFTRSEAEERLLDIVRSARLPAPELNVKVFGHEVDFLWRSARLVVEVDGYAYHSDAHNFAADRRRDAELVAAGYRVLRFTWADVTAERLATIVKLVRALYSQ